MAEQAGWLWLGAWCLLLFVVVVRNIDANRRKYAAEHGEPASVWSIVKMRRWQFGKLPLVGIFLAAIAEGVAPLGRFLAMPQFLEGCEMIALAAIALVLLVALWRVR